MSSLTSTLTSCLQLFACPLCSSQPPNLASQAVCAGEHMFSSCCEELRSEVSCMKLHSQPNTFVQQNNVQLKAYPLTVEGLIESVIERDL